MADDEDLAVPADDEDVSMSTNEEDVNLADVNNNGATSSLGYSARDALSDYGHWQLSDLKRELRLREARTTGRKKDLVQRLRDLDKLQDHAEGDSIAVASGGGFNELDWPSGVFRSIMADSREVLPPIKEEHVEMYVRLCQGHNVVVGWHSGALKKAQCLLSDKL